MRSYFYIWHVLYAASFVGPLSVRTHYGTGRGYFLVKLDLFARGGRRAQGLGQRGSVTFSIPRPAAQMASLLQSVLPRHDGGLPRFITYSLGWAFM